MMRHFIESVVLFGSSQLTQDFCYEFLLLLDEDQLIDYYNLCDLQHMNAFMGYSLKTTKNENYIFSYCLN
jgi:hypothetical protein